MKLLSFSKNGQSSFGLVKDDAVIDLKSKFNQQYASLRDLLAVDNYLEKTGRRVMFEYLLIKEVNDRDEDAQMLAKLLNKPLYLLNLIPYNQTGRFQPSSSARTKRFMELVEKTGMPVTIRHSLGQEVDAACGQLAGKRKNK